MIRSKLAAAVLFALTALSFTPGLGYGQADNPTLRKFAARGPFQTVQMMGGPGNAFTFFMPQPLRAAGQASGLELRAALAGPGPHGLDPETAARAFRVLRDLGLVAGDTSAGTGVVGVVSSEGTDLDRSAAFRVYSKDFSEARSFLQSPKFP